MGSQLEQAVLFRAPSTFRLSKGLHQERVCCTHYRWTYIHIKFIPTKYINTLLSYIALSVRGMLQSVYIFDVRGSSVESIARRPQMAIGKVSQLIDSEFHSRRMQGPQRPDAPALSRRQQCPLVGVLCQGSFPPQEIIKCSCARC